MAPLLVVGDGRWKEDDPRNPCVPRSRIVNRVKEKKNQVQTHESCPFV
jgi:hypothetical protein